MHHVTMDGLFLWLTCMPNAFDFNAQQGRTQLLCHALGEVIDCKLHLVLHL